MTYDPDRNGADSYTLAISHIREHGWRCLGGDRCKVAKCFNDGKCALNGESLIKKDGEFVTVRTTSKVRRHTMLTYDGQMAVYVGRAAKVFDVPCTDILSDRRGRASVLARHAAIWAARHGTPYSYPRIGRYFRRDYTSIMYAVQKAEARCADDLDYARSCQLVLNGLAE